MISIVVVVLGVSGNPVEVLKAVVVLCTLEVDVVVDVRVTDELSLDIMLSLEYREDIVLTAVVGVVECVYSEFAVEITVGELTELEIR